MAAGVCASINRPIPLFFGCGVAYEAYKHLFFGTIPQAISVGPTQNLPRESFPVSIDGIPVRFAEEVLLTEEMQRIPMVIFVKSEFVNRITYEIQRKYSDYPGQQFVCALFKDNVPMPYAILH